MNDALLAIIKEHTTEAEYDALLLDAQRFSYAEAAELLGISINAYRQRLTRARRRLRKYGTSRRVG